MIRACALLLSLLLLLTGCGESKPRRWALLDGTLRQHWKLPGMEHAGAVTWHRGSGLDTSEEVELAAGAPMTGLRFDGWQALGLPVRDYTIHFEAQRVKGTDFFAAVTFPVRDLEHSLTLVVGGWGGGLMGISDIDGLSANENDSRGEHQFEQGRWYRIRLELKDDDLRAWLDDRLVVNISLRGRTLSLRPGEIGKCAPFGLATYWTTGRMRGLTVEAR